MKPSISRPPFRSWGVAAVGVACLALFILGYILLLRFEARPGDVGAAPAVWPASSRLERAAEGPTLVLVGHPRCPCTRASLAELERILEQNRDDALRAYVLFVVPTEEDGAWTRSPLVQSAESIRGARVLLDPGGREAQRFGVETSGHVLVYDAGGKLQFSGGITVARGHEGDGDGRRAVLALATKGTSAIHDASVYGCALGADAAPKTTKATCCK